MRKKNHTRKKDSGIFNILYQDFKNNQKSKEKKEIKQREDKIKKELEKIKQKDKEIKLKEKELLRLE